MAQSSVTSTEFNVLAKLSLESSAKSATGQRVSQHDRLEIEGSVQEFEDSLKSYKSDTCWPLIVSVVIVAFH